jgi:hypothetical protein
MRIPTLHECVVAARRAAVPLAVVQPHGRMDVTEPAAEDRCPSCLMTGFEALVLPCAHCGIGGCDLCIFDGDPVYNDPTCCAAARAQSEAWWAMSGAERRTHDRCTAAAASLAGGAP